MTSSTNTTYASMSQIEGPVPVATGFRLFISEHEGEPFHQAVLPLFPPAARFISFKALFSMEGREAAGSQAARAQRGRENLFGGCYGWEGCAKEESCFQGSIYMQVSEVGLQRSSFPGCLRHSLNNSGQSCSKLHGLVSEHGLEQPRWVLAVVPASTRG